MFREKILDIKEYLSENKNLLFLYLLFHPYSSYLIIIICVKIF